MGDAECTLSPAEDTPPAGGAGQRSAPTGKFEVYRDKARKYRFRLKAGNGQTIAISDASQSKAACLNGIDSVQQNAPDAAVVEVGD